MQNKMQTLSGLAFANVFKKKAGDAFIRDNKNLVGGNVIGCLEGQDGDNGNACLKKGGFRVNDLR